MKTINLRWMYPHYRHNEFVDVTDEVWAAMYQAQREMENYERRKVYHRAWYSLDAYSWTENYALEHGRSPEDILVEREEMTTRLRLIAALPAALAHATPTQARRVHAYYIAGMQQLHEKISDMNTRYYDLRGEIVKAERRVAVLTERGEMWAQYNKYKAVHKQLAKVKPEKRELFEQRHSRELILYDAAARYLKELKDSGEGITPKAWQREIDQLAAGKQTDTLAMKAMREDLKAVERLRKTAEQLSRQERDKSYDRGSER